MSECRLSKDRKAGEEVGLDRSQSLIVLSAEEEASKFRCDRFQDRERIESTWYSGLATTLGFLGFFFFFFFPLPSPTVNEAVDSVMEEVEAIGRALGSFGGGPRIASG